MLEICWEGGIAAVCHDFDRAKTMIKSVARIDGIEYGLTEQTIQIKITAVELCISGVLSINVTVD